MSININDVLDLARAGYNREEISALLGAAPKDPDPEPEKKPEPQPEPQPDPAPAPQPDMAALVARMDELTRTIQATNVLQSRQPAPETADDILAAIIRPPRKE